MTVIYISLAVMGLIVLYLAYALGKVWVALENTSTIATYVYVYHTMTDKDFLSTDTLIKVSDEIERTLK